MAQEGEGEMLVRYTPDFEFRDGIYANFDMVLANDPIPPARIVTDLVSSTGPFTTRSPL